LKEGIPSKQAEQEGLSSRPIDVLISSNQLFLGLKQLDLTVQDVLKFEKILKNKGLIETTVKKYSKESEGMLDYLRRFWDYDRSHLYHRKALPWR
jgi:hypothetical protein